MRGAFLCVGISDYPVEALTEDEKALRFAAQSAKSLGRCIRQAFDVSLDDGLVLTDAEASPENIRESSASFADKGYFDFLVFYIACHGRGKSVLLLENSKAVTVLGREIAKNFKEIDASHKVLIFDCCYAGKVAQSAAEVEMSNTSLLAATGETDKAWEVSELERTCFSASIEEVLRNAKKQDGIGVLETEFDKIRARTASNAFGFVRGERQEPQLIVGSNSIKKSLSVWNALRRRVRQILIGAFFASALIMMTVFALTYRLGVEQDNRLVVYYGHKSLSFLNIGPFKVRRQTRFKLVQIPESTDERDKLIQQKIWGLWTRRNEKGYPDWLDKITVTLRPEIRERVGIDLGAEPDFSDPELAPHIVAQWRLLKRSEFQEPPVLTRYWEQKFRELESNCGSASQGFDSVSVSRLRCEVAHLKSLNEASAASRWFADDFLRNLIVRYSGVSSTFLSDRSAQEQIGFEVIRVVQTTASRLARQPNANSAENIRKMLDYLSSVGEGQERLALIVLAILGLEDDDLSEKKLWRAYEERIRVVSVSDEVGKKLLSTEPGKSTVELYADPLFGLVAVGKRHKFDSGSPLLSETLESPNLEKTDVLPFEVIFGAGQVSENLRAIVSSEINRKLKNLDANTLSELILLMRLAARQAPYVDGEEYEQLIEQALRLDAEVNSILADAPAQTRELATYSLDEIWGLISMGGWASQVIQSRLAPAARTEVEFLREPSYTNIQSVPHNRLSWGIRTVAASRLGLTQNLGEETLAAIGNRAVAIFEGWEKSSRPPFEYYDPIYKQIIPQLDDAHLQLVTMLLSVGRHRYGEIATEELAFEIRSALLKRRHYAQQTLLEEHMAEAWIRKHPPQIQVQILDDLYELWKAERESDVRISIARVIRIAQVLPSLSNTSAAAALERGKRRSNNPN